MSWKSRSEENLEAGRLCETNGLHAPAIARYYYAAYHAALHILDQVGPGAPEERDGEDYWPHVAVARTLGALFSECEMLEARYELLRSRRVRADYRLNPINAGQAKTVRETAEALLEDLWRCVEDADLS